MKILNTLETYTTLNSVQSKYFFGVTSGDNPREIATAKQLWKLQDFKQIISLLLCDRNSSRCL